MFGKINTHEHKLAKIEALDFLPLKGKINLNNPNQIFYWIEHKKSLDVITYYFGPLVCYSLRDKLPLFRLTNRKYISNTSMDPTLSFYMANLAQIGQDDLVIDPFVGTGGLLIGAAVRGAYVMGIEVERKLLMGRGKSSRTGQTWKNRDETVLNNMRQYSLESKFIDVILGDSTGNLFESSRSCEICDAIITDPPYGIRESAKKFTIVSHDETTLKSTGYIYSRLYRFATLHLKPGKRLVFWMPYACENDDESFVKFEDMTTPEFESFVPYPKDYFTFESCNFQYMCGKKMGRLLICLKKKCSLNQNTPYDLNSLTFLDGFREKYFTPAQSSKL